MEDHAAYSTNFGCGKGPDATSAYNTEGRLTQRLHDGVGGPEFRQLVIDLRLASPIPFRIVFFADRERVPQNFRKLFHRDDFVFQQIARKRMPEPTRISGGYHPAFLFRFSLSLLTLHCTLCPGRFRQAHALAATLFMSAVDQQHAMTIPQPKARIRHVKFAQPVSY